MRRLTRKHKSTAWFVGFLLLATAMSAIAEPPVVENAFAIDRFTATGKTDTGFFVSFQDQSLIETGFEVQWKLDSQDDGAWQDVGDLPPRNNPPQITGTAPSLSAELLPEVCPAQIPTQEILDFRGRAKVTHDTDVPESADLVNGAWKEDIALAGPCPPTNVAVTLAGSYPKITWVNDPLPDSLKKEHWIYRSTNRNIVGSGQPIKRVLLSQPSEFIDTEAPRGTKVYYLVAAARQKAIGTHLEESTSPADTIGEIDVPGTNPTPTPTGTGGPTFDPPTNLVAQLIGTSQAKLTWVDNSTTEDGFFIDFGKDSCACDMRYVLASPNTTQYTQNGLPQDATRFYRVRAYRNSDSAITDPSNLAWVDTPPTAPTNLRKDAATNTYVDLRWNDNSFTEDGFRVEYCNGNCGDSMPWNFLGNVTANQVTFRDGTVTGNLTRSYRVFATKGLLLSARSNILVVTTPPAPLNPPINLVASQIPNDAHRLSLAWTNNDPDTQSYRIEYASVPAGPWGTLATGVGVTSYIDDFALNAGQQRCYRVRGFNMALGSSDPSNVSCAQTAGAQVPIDPTNLTGVALDSARIKLTWTDNATNEDGFKVYRSTNGGQSYLLWKTLTNTDPALGFCGGSCRTHTVTGLYPGTPYTFKVTAYNQDGESGPTNAVTVTTLGPPMPVWINPSPDNQGFTEDGEPLNDSVYTCVINGKAEGVGVDFVRVRVFDTVQGVFLADPALAPVNATTHEWSITWQQYNFNPGRYNLVAYSRVIVDGLPVWSQPAYINGWLIPADHAPCPITDP